MRKISFHSRKLVFSLEGCSPDVLNLSVSVEILGRKRGTLVGEV